MLGITAPTVVELVVLLFPLLVLGLAYFPAKVARDKGYSFAAFYVFGVFLWLPAIIVAAMLQPKITPPGRSEPDRASTGSSGS